MIDLHCHFLPGIDDGADTMDEAIELARAAVDNGIRCAIMTPHLHPGRYENTAGTIAAHLRNFRRALEQADVPLRVGYAAEVRLASETLPMIQSGQVPFLGELDGYKVMLLEFPHGHIPLGSDKLVQKLLDMKIRPLIAHPERNKDVMRNLDKITPFIEMGCLLQLTAASVANKFGDNAYRRAVQLLESDAAIVLATDSHNLKARPPHLRQGMEAAAEIVGREAAHDMVQRLPRAIVNSQFSKKAKPQPARAKGGVVNITRSASEARQGAARTAAVSATAAISNRNPQLEYEIQQAIRATLPGAIKLFFEDRLSMDLEEELVQDIKSRLSDTLQEQLATQLQQNLTPDVRDKIMADVIEEARNKAYEEFKSQHRNQFERELFFNMLAKRKEHEKLVDLMGNLVGLLQLIDSFEDSSELISKLLEVARELR